MNPIEPSRDGDQVFEILVRDHDIVKNLLAELALPGDLRLRRTMLNRLKTVLAVHNATEELVIYPALKVLARRKDRSDELYRETAEADVLVFDIDNLRDDADAAAFDEKAAKLRDAVVAHIEKEESAIFQAIVEAIGEDGCKRLTQAVREFRSAFDPSPSRERVREAEGLG
jgi:hemerythrin superfamily protein